LEGTYKYKKGPNNNDFSFLPIREIPLLMPKKVILLKVLHTLNRITGVPDKNIKKIPKKESTAEYRHPKTKKNYFPWKILLTD